MSVQVEGLSDVLRAWGDLPSEARKAVYGDTVSVFRPQWVGGIKSGMRRRSFAQPAALTTTGVTFALGNNGPTGYVYTSNKVHRGGMVASSRYDNGYGPWEFGVNNRAGLSSYRRRSPKGTYHDVERHIRDRMPMRREEGYVVYPLVAKLAPDIISYWTASIVRAAYAWQRN
jgi:hypothetical protein